METKTLKQIGSGELGSRSTICIYKVRKYFRKRELKFIEWLVLKQTYERLEFQA